MRLMEGLVVLGLHFRFLSGNVHCSHSEARHHWGHCPPIHSTLALLELLLKLLGELQMRRRVTRLRTSRERETMARLESHDKDAAQTCAQLQKTAYTLHPDNSKRRCGAMGVRTYFSMKSDSSVRGSSSADSMLCGRFRIGVQVPARC